MWVTKLLISPVKKRIFCPKTTKFGIFGQFGPGHAGLFSALLVGPLVFVARGLYLARHLFTLFLDGRFNLFSYEKRWSRVLELMSPKHFQCCSAFCKILRHSPNISIKKVGVKYMQGTRKAWNGLYGSPNYLITFGYRMWY